MLIQLMLGVTGPTIRLEVDVVPRIGELLDLEELQDFQADNPDMAEMPELYRFGRLVRVIQVIHRPGPESPVITVQVLTVSSGIMDG